MNPTEPHNVAPLPVAARPRQTANWIIAIALSVIATTLLLRPDLPLLGPAFAQNTLVGSHGIHAFTGQLDKNTFGLFMMDVDVGTIWVYEYNPLKKKLRLAAARAFTYDRYLQSYNNDEGTSPAQIEKLVERERKSRVLARADRPTDANLPPEATEPAVEPPAEKPRPRAAAPAAQKPAGPAPAPAARAQPAGNATEGVIDEAP
ncbi:MAG: hypothetical protein U1A27_06605 [Phycisphaerae bacterium]